MTPPALKPVKLNQQFIADKAETWSDPDGISYLRYLPETDINHHDMMQIFLQGAGGSMVADRKLALVSDLRFVNTISKAALDLTVSPQVLERIGAMAIVADHLAARDLAHHYISDQKPDVPTRVFSTLEQARLWLLGLVNDGSIE
ncbi:MAG: hypothetical protein MUC87_22330 [Bacteroidia bacterium]|nr:hypothetical protein [Bacteroidia bacterium]